MPWTKIKNMAIFLLLVANLCLLAFVLAQQVQTSRLRGQALDNAVIYLRDRGVQVDMADIPQSMDLPPLTVERDLEGEEQTARALLRGRVTVQALPAEVYRYENENGAVQFHSDGTFSAQLVEGSFPLGEDRTESCRALLEQVGFQGVLTGIDGDELTFRQHWKDTPMFSQQVTVLCGETGIAALSGGRRLVGQPTTDPTRKTITVATALIDLHNGIAALGDVCSRIDRIWPGYVTASSLPGTMSLTPVWRVTTDTGAYQLDTVTGQVARLS